jgi:hypothetical protein
MINIICYAGGTCGDLITTLIDSKNVSLNENIVTIHEERTKFKKPFLFNNNSEKDLYLLEMSKKYFSIPSHDIEYHKEKKHSFIGITVQDRSCAEWAASRFKDLHRPHVWKEMTHSCGAGSVSEYAQILIDYSNMIQKFTNCIIKLEDIVNGNAIKILTEFGITGSSNADEFYNLWLSKQKVYRQ